jgi:hypothetical protein
VTLATFVMAVSALGQLNTGQIGMDEQNLSEFSARQPLIANYSSGAPEPVVPSSPENLGINIPAESVTYSEALLAVESERALIPIDGPFSLKSSNDQINTIVEPSEIEATNQLYVSSIYQTVANLPLYGWLPICLQINSPGPIWLYEWYPNGTLDVKYLGLQYPGWYKIWFHGEIFGWHILQYYSKGWSNYVYVYVSGSREWNELIPSPGSRLNQRPWLLYDDPWIKGGISNKIESRKTVTQTTGGPWVDPAPDENPLDPSIPHW